MGGEPDSHWLCTDVGSRTVVAIKIEPTLGADWYRGPPYAVNETVLDEDDLLSCLPILFVDIIIQ